MQELIPFFLVFFTAVFFSEVFKRLHLPWVVALILGGIVIGPFGFGFLELNTTIEFIGQIGLVFLMFMAGLETELSIFKQARKDVFIISVLNGLIPFLSGFIVGHLLGLEFQTSLLIGIIFISSATAVVIPVFESIGLMKARLGKTIMASVIVQDVFSLVLLSIFLQKVSPTSSIPLPLFLLLLVGTFLLFRFLIPKIQWLFLLGKNKIGDVFQQELRVVFTILIGVVIAFELIGLHAIIAGFIAGLILSDVVNTQSLKDKIKVISYGFFIPIFFVVLGAKTDISVFAETKTTIFLTALIVFVSVLSKLSSGWISGIVLKYRNYSSALIGFSTIPSLSITLAVAFTGVELGILSVQLSTAFVILSLVTVFVSPIMVRFLGNKVISESSDNLIARNESERSSNDIL